MKISCLRTELAAAVTNASRAVSSKSAIPALEGVLLKAQGEKLNISGYNLEIGITSDIEATVQQPGEVVVSAKLFLDIVRRLPEEIVTIRRGTEDFKIKRLNGAERLKFNDLTGQYERILFVISHALLSGAQNAPIGEQNAAKFIERYGSLAEALFNDIFDLTQKSLEKESEIWELAKKNSENPETTSA